ncbi:MAG: VOC family protein [Chloroflexi bacterium]|nr:VOC family protein [Chloroflexota bacterium]
MFGLPSTPTSSSVIQPATSLMIDHAVIVVKDLEEAMVDYTDLGFNVVKGGQHTDGISQNALIGFHDGSYIELYDVLRWPESPPEDRLKNRFIRNAARGEGLSDFALLTDDMSGLVQEAAHRGLVLHGPTEGGRMRPDGQELRWLSAVPEEMPYPFLIQDVTENYLRLPDQLEHPNGANGIAGLIVAVGGLGEAVEPFNLLLDSSPIETRSDLPGSAGLDYTLPGATLTLMMPIGLNSPLHDPLTQRGPSPFQLKLYTDDIDRVGLLDLEKTHGARIEMVG